MADVAMSELNPSIERDEKTVASVALVKTTMQQHGPLKKVAFTDYSDAIKKHSSITPTCVSVRLPLNGELYGFDVEIPEGHQIDVNKTVIKPRKNDILITIVKIGEFTLHP